MAPMLSHSQSEES